MNKKFCISKKLLMISFIFVVLIGFVYLITNTLNKGKQVTSSSAKEKISISSSFNSDSQITNLKKSIVFRNFKFNTNESTNSRNNKYYFLANIIVNLKQNNSLSSALILNDLYKNYYLKGKSPNEAYQKIIEKNFNNISTVLTKTMGSNPFKNILESSPAPTSISFPKCGFLDWIKSFVKDGGKRCFCLGQYSLDICRGVGSPLQEAQQVALNYAAVNNMSIDPKLVEIINNAIRIYNISSPLIKTITAPTISTTVSSEPQIVGYDLSALDGNLQLTTASELITSANETPGITTEIEVGYGFRNNPCPIDTLCVKVDLNILDEAGAIQDKITSVNESGMTIWISGNFNNMTTVLSGGSGVDRIYMIAPFPGNSGDLTKFSPLVRSSYNTLESGGQLFIMPLPRDLDGMIRNVLLIVPRENVQGFYLNGLQQMSEYNTIPWIMNPQSDYLEGLTPEQIPVIVITK